MGAPGISPSNEWMNNAGKDIGNEGEGGGNDMWGALLAAGLPFLGDLLGIGGQQQAQTQFVPGVTQSDVYGSNQLRLGQESASERELAGLQQNLFRGGAAALQGGLPQELGLGNLARGEIGGRNQERIRRLAFSGLDEGLRRASSIASENALARGIPLSSVQGMQEAALQRPLIEQGQDRMEALSLAELGRLEGLRQNFLSNSLALQQSPALQRLTELRLAEGKQESLQLTREPGGLPQGMGPEDRRTPAQKISDLNKILMDLTTQLIAQGIPDHRRHKIVNAKRRELAAANGFGVENFNIVEQASTSQSAPPSPRVQQSSMFDRNRPRSIFD